MRLIQIEFRPPVHGNLETLTLFRLPSISPSGTMCFICLTFPDSEVKRGAGKKHIGKPVPTFIQCFQAKVSGQTLRNVAQCASPFRTTAPNSESGGQEFESLRARHFQRHSVRFARQSHDPSRRPRVMAFQRTMFKRTACLTWPLHVDVENCGWL